MGGARAGLHPDAEAARAQPRPQPRGGPGHGVGGQRSPPGQSVMLLIGQCYVINATDWSMLCIEGH